LLNWCILVTSRLFLDHHTASRWLRFSDSWIRVLYFMQAGWQLMRLHHHLAHDGINTLDRTWRHLVQGNFHRVNPRTVASRVIDHSGYQPFPAACDPRLVNGIERSVHKRTVD
jgi:hypothetical protein